MRKQTPRFEELKFNSERKKTGTVMGKKEFTADLKLCFVD